METTPNFSWNIPDSAENLFPAFRQTLIEIDEDVNGLSGGFSGFDDPSAEVGLTAVNGSATTAMRSDAAPALDQGIEPTWTSDHTFNADVIFGNGNRKITVPNGISGLDWYSLTIAPASAGEQSIFKVNFPNHDNKIVLNESVSSGHWTGRLILDTQDDIGVGGFALEAINDSGNASGFQGYLHNLQYDEFGHGTVLQIADGVIYFPQLAANGLLRIAAGDGEISVDTTTYATQAYADSLVVGLLDDRGNYNASGNTFPASGGSGSAGAILKGDLWTISVAGTLGGVAVNIGDQVRALTDTPGQTASNWAISEANIGYVPLSQSLADGKIYVGNGSGIGTAVTPSGDLSMSNAGAFTITAQNSLFWRGKVSDETGSGLWVFNDSPTLITPVLGVASGTSLSLSGNLVVGGHVLPSLPDASDVGAASAPFRKGYISELDTVLFSQNAISVIGSRMVIAKGEGTADEDIDTSETQIDFGTNNIAANDFIVFRANGAVEYMQATSLVSGNTWNVTRNVDGSGANTWPQGSVWVNYGNLGTGRIELNASDTPRIQILTQGATYNAQTELLRMGDLDGNWGYAAATYGFAVGKYASGFSSITVDELGVISIKNGTTERIGLSAAGVMTFKDSAGAAKITLDASAGMTLDGKLQMLGASSAIAIGTTPPTSASAGTGIWLDRTGLYGLASGTPKTAISATTGRIVATQIDIGVIDSGNAITSPLFSVDTLGNVAAAGISGVSLGIDAIVTSEMLVTNAVTNALSDVMIFRHVSSGTPAAGFGSSVLLKIASASNSSRDAARFGALWTTATDASRTSAAVIHTVNNAGSLAEVARFAGNGDFTPTGNVLIGSGKAINFNSGDVTLTHSADLLTIAGGDLLVSGLLKAGSGPTTLTDSVGKILPAALPAGIWARAYHNADQSLTTATLTAIALNSERDDTDTIHDNSTNNSRLTCKTAGLYTISGSLLYLSNATGFRDAAIRLNGSTYIAFNRSPAVNGEDTSIIVATQYRLAVNDYVELIGQQTSGGNLNVRAAGNFSPEFTMTRLGA